LKKTIVCILVILGLIGYIRWCNRPDNGIHGIGKNVCLIEGECVVINWDASPREAELALEKWHELKK
jgi:hypothetical protein